MNRTMSALAAAAFSVAALTGCTAPNAAAEPVVVTAGLNEAAVLPSGASITVMPKKFTRPSHGPGKVAVLDVTIQNDSSETIDARALSRMEVTHGPGDVRARPVHDRSRGNRPSGSIDPGAVTTFTAAFAIPARDADDVTVSIRQMSSLGAGTSFHGSVVPARK